MTFSDLHAEAEKHLAEVRAAGATEAMEKTMGLVVRLCKMLAEAEISVEPPAPHAEPAPVTFTEVPAAKRERKPRQPRG